MWSTLGLRVGFNFHTVLGKRRMIFMGNNFATDTAVPAAAVIATALAATTTTKGHASGPCSGVILS